MSLVMNARYYGLVSADWEPDPMTSRGERAMSIMDLYPVQNIHLHGGLTRVEVRPHMFEADRFVCRVFTKVAGSRFKPHWRELNERNHPIPVGSALRIYHGMYNGVQS